MSLEQITDKEATDTNPQENLPKKGSGFLQCISRNLYARVFGAALSVLAPIIEACSACDEFEQKIDQALAVQQAADHMKILFNKGQELVEYFKKLDKKYFEQHGSEVPKTIEKGTELIRAMTEEARTIRRAGIRINPAVVKFIFDQTKKGLAILNDYKYDADQLSESWFGQTLVNLFSDVNSKDLIAAGEKLTVLLREIHELRRALIAMIDYDVAGFTNNDLVNASVPAQLQNLELTVPLEPTIPLSKGDSGNGVKKLQQILIMLGYLKYGNDDGSFGGGTQSALLRFQKDSLIYEENPEEKGIFGGKTRERLLLCLSIFTGDLMQRITKVHILDNPTNRGFGERETREGCRG